MSPPRTSLLVAATAVCVLLVLATGGCATSHRDGQSAGRSAATTAFPASTESTPSSAVGRARRLRVVAAAEVLRRWDGRRAAAYAHGDVGALRRLYTPASVAGRRDAGVLQRYAGRGLVVRRMQTQVLAIEVRRWTRHRLVLVSRDRLVGAVATSPERGTRRMLPADRADRWRLTLVHSGTGDAGPGWRMATVAAR